MRKKFAAALLDLVAPRDLACVLCGTEQRIVPGSGLCSACAQSMERQVIVKRVCHNVNAYSLLAHDGAAADLVYGLKYGGKGYNAYVLGRFMCEAVREHVRPDTVIVPVPQHITRYLFRGYNPAEYLARDLAERLGLRIVPALKKTRRTPHQTGSSAIERQQNLRNAFKVPDAALIRGRDVLLTDDVLTTGATCRACVLPMLAAGAKSVVCVTATCTVDEHERADLNTTKEKINIFLQPGSKA